ncbi:MAG: T9SS type A sorting domain-containing protein [Ferruginibacter sp.]
MKRNSTSLCSVLCTVTFFLLSLTGVNAQCIAPKMNYSNPQLVSGTALQKNSVYKFSSVTPGVDAFITVEDLVGGATLTSIDNNILGYDAAWQPVVKTPTTQGASESYVNFSIQFRDSADGMKHKYNCFVLSFIDIDGDNVGVREFVATRKFDSYSVSNITSLIIDNENKENGDEDENHQGEQDGLLKAIGPVLNYTNLDTTAYATNINFRFRNKDKVQELRIGNVTNNNFTVQDRYTCGYFQNIVIPYMSLLPVKYSSFDAVVIDNKSVNLKWITSFEQNTNHFEVERSFDMINFKTIGIVLDGLTNGGTDKIYQFKDNSAELAGKRAAYYRLRQIDRDGKTTYSVIVAVSMYSKDQGKVDMQISPNPFTEKLLVRFVSNDNGTAEIRIINMTGQVVVSNQAKISKGINNLQINGLNTLGFGMYIAQVSVNGIIIDKQKIIKN